MLSDHYGRRPIVIIAGVLQSIAPFSFLFWNSFSFVILMGMVFGMGYGAYVSIDWALASDNLPSTSSHAKDLGVWHIALALPMVMGPPIAGILLDSLEPLGKEFDIAHLGWKVLWTFCGCLFVSGTLCIRKLKDAAKNPVALSPSATPVEELAEEVIHMMESPPNNNGNSNNNINSSLNFEVDNSRMVI